MRIPIQGELFRDEGIERVSSNSGTFISEGLSFISSPSLKPGDYTGEDIRIKLSELGIEPHHCNAWGALIMHAVRKGYITNTGRIRKSKLVQAHAHKATIYNKK